MPIHVNNFLSWVQLREVSVNDSGTWRSLREIYTNDGGTWRKIFSRGLHATLVAGFLDPLYGYSSSSAFGSMSEVTLYDNRVVTDLYYSTSNSRLSINISGFGGTDPGQAYLDSLDITGASQLLGSSAAVYLYLAGDATWQWNIANPFVNGGSYVIDLVTGA
jgi:hypothetical protein